MVMLFIGLIVLNSLLSCPNADANEKEGLGPSMVSTPYTPDWESLDQRPLPSWYDEAKIGIFLHWGVFSVPSYGSEWFWWQWKGDPALYPNVVDYMKQQYAPNFSYEQFAAQFRAEFFNPPHWAEVFEDSGAKYVVLTSKHHEGFCNWPSATAFQWNAVDVGPRRDLVGELAETIRNRTDIRFGLYYSLFEWFNPMYSLDKDANFTTQEYVDQKVMPELMEVINRYKPEILWSDGDWTANSSYWKSREFLAWLYNDSPVRNTIVTNDRWGSDCLCRHGGYYTCQDHYQPSHLVQHKWENCMTLDKKSWGYRRDASLTDIVSPEELIYDVVRTVAFGGNVLINVGPTAWGTITSIYEERLRQLGGWLRINGEAIYGTKPWRIQNEVDANFIWYTTKPKNATSIISPHFELHGDVNRQDTPTVYAIFTQEGLTNRTVWTLGTPVCHVSKIFLPSVLAKSGVSEFYLLDGSETGRMLQYNCGTCDQPGVTLYLAGSERFSLLETRWGCAIKMKNVS